MYMTFGEYDKECVNCNVTTYNYELFTCFTCKTRYITCRNCNISSTCQGCVTKKCLKCIKKPYICNTSLCGECYNTHICGICIKCLSFSCKQCASCHGYICNCSGQSCKQCNVYYCYKDLDKCKECLKYFCKHCHPQNKECFSCGENKCYKCFYKGNYHSRIRIIKDICTSCIKKDHKPCINCGQHTINIAKCKTNKKHVICYKKGCQKMLQRFKNCPCEICKRKCGEYNYTIIKCLSCFTFGRCFIKPVKISYSYCDNFSWPRTCQDCMDKKESGQILKYHNKIGYKTCYLSLSYICSDHKDKIGYCRGCRKTVDKKYLKEEGYCISCERIVIKIQRKYREYFYRPDSNYVLKILKKRFEKSTNIISL